MEDQVKITTTINGKDHLSSQAPKLATLYTIVKVIRLLQVFKLFTTNLSRRETVEQIFRAVMARSNLLVLISTQREEKVLHNSESEVLMTDL